jgi:hypothetical protein
MADEAPTSVTPPKAPKERSPSFPFIPLQAAVKRLEEFERHFGRHPTPANHVGAAWGMKPASSKAAQTVAALKSFGFVEYEGGGPARLTRLSELARTYLRAQQESVKREAIRTAAMRPKALQSFFKQWGADRPTDPVCLDELILKRDFNDAAARLFLKVYDQTIAFAGLGASDMEGITEPAADDTDEEDEQDTVDHGTPPKPITIGDLVQRDVNGVLTFPAPRKVTGVFLDQKAGWMVSVDGYAGAFPMSEIQPFTPAAQPASPATPEASVTPAAQPPAPSLIPQPTNGGKDPIETFLANGRLQINANVGVEGIARLKQMLDKYEELMQLMN